MSENQPNAPKPTPTPSNGPTPMPKPPAMPQKPGANPGGGQPVGNVAHPPPAGASNKVTPSENQPTGSNPKGPTAAGVGKGPPQPVKNSAVSQKIRQILEEAYKADASDIHLIAHHPPTFRVHQIIEPTDMEVLTPELARAMFDEMAGDKARRTFDEVHDADFSYAVEGLARYRVNAHMQSGAVGMALRAIKTDVPPLAELQLPEVIARLTYLPRGLVLVTGDTGSGKSTTLAAMIQAMNERYRKHIITLEDPVEYVFESDQCLLEQRELGRDMPSFSSGLKHALRQDPDIVLVGEMRDLETTALAISAAETGHLVLSTLHTVNAAQTVERIIDMYPTGQQNQVRSMLASTLQAVVSQTLFSRVDRPGMVPAVETLLATSAVRNLIRENRTFEIPNVIETSRAIGMASLDSSIAELYFNGLISKEDAIAQAAYPDKLERQLVA